MELNSGYSRSPQEICAFLQAQTSFFSKAQLFLQEIVKLHGVPRVIISDRGTVFLGSFWQELHTLQGTQLKFSSSYHPETDDQTERLNRCLEDYLRCFVCDKPKDWPNWLHWDEFCYNTAYHTSIKITPFKAVYW